MQSRFRAGPILKGECMILPLYLQPTGRPISRTSGEDWKSSSPEEVLTQEGLLRTKSRQGRRALLGATRSPRYGRFPRGLRPWGRNQAAELAAMIISTNEKRCGLAQEEDYR